MGVAPYFQRTKIAASQVIAGFDAEAFTSALEATSVGISFDDDVVTSQQGMACLDLLTRLCARLYPQLAFVTPNNATGALDTAVASLTNLSTAINPNVAITDDASTIVHIGTGQLRNFHDAAGLRQRATADNGGSARQVIYIGCNDWGGQLSMEHPLPVGPGVIPVGGGVAACLAASALFRLLLDPTAPRPGEAALMAVPNPPAAASFVLPARTAVVGAGAIGEAFIWTLARTPVTGDLHVVEPEPVELSNLQRYVLTDMSHVSKPKTEVVGDHVRAVRADSADFEIREHQAPWADVMDEIGPDWELAAVAVDSADARRQVQASLPHIVVNAWTQSGDLGVSSHDFLGGACCACLYLPLGTSRNEDEIVAAALGVPDHVVTIRALLYDGRPVPEDLLELIAERLNVHPSAAETFLGTSVRGLYVDGICGGGLVPLANNPEGNPVHVPLAHQSALAGVLLAARILDRASGESPRSGTEITRVDVRRDPPEMPHQAQAKDPRGICLCQDDDYLAAYRQSWSVSTP